jgi:hypothetical protein
MNMILNYNEPGLKGRVIERTEGLFVVLEFFAYNREPMVEEYPIAPTNTYLEDGMWMNYSLNELDASSIVPTGVGLISSPHL